MDSDDIEHIISAHYKNFEKYSEKITKHFDGETIHKFRVEYKRLRAFVRMISQNKSGNFGIKIPKHLKNVYHTAGSIRDLQLHLIRINNAIGKGNKKPKKYCHLLKNKIKKLQPQLLDRFSKLSLNGNKKDTKTSIPIEFTFQCFKELASKKWSEIYTIIAFARYSDDNIHTIRKNLKDLLYNLKTFNGNEGLLLSKEILNGKDEACLDQLLEELGSFQDKRMAISLLKTEWLNGLPACDKQLLAGLKYDWLIEKKNMKQALIKRLETEFASNKSFPYPGS